MPILASFYAFSPFYMLLPPINSKFSAHGSVFQSVVYEVLLAYETNTVANVTYTTTNNDNIFLAS